MNEIGDPVWNEVKKSNDPFIYRDYIAKNPNSPFTAQAKEKMNALAAMTVAWEQIKDSNDDEKFGEFLGKYPNSPYAKEVANKVIALYTKKIKIYYPSRLKITIDTTIWNHIYDINFVDKCRINFSDKNSYDEEVLHGAYLEEALIDLSFSSSFDVAHKTEKKL